MKLYMLPFIATCIMLQLYKQKIFNDQEYKEIPKEEQEITAMVIDTKTEKKEFYLSES